MEIDEICQDVIAAIWNHPSEQVETGQVIKRTGYDRHKIRYRFQKLEENGYLNIDQKDHGQGIPPLLVSFTDEGKQAIQKAEFGDIYQNSDEVTLTREQFDDFRRAIERLEIRLDSMQDQHDTMIQMEDDFELVKEQINEIVPIVGGLYNAVDEMLPDDTTVEDFIDKG